MWPWVDPEAVLWQFRLLPPPLCPWNVYFTCHSHSWSWPKDMALRQWGGVETILMDRIPLRLLYKRLRFWRAESTRFVALKTSLLQKFPCLLNLPLTNLAWSASFFELSLPSVHRSHQRNSWSHKLMIGKPGRRPKKWVLGKRHLWKESWVGHLTSVRCLWMATWVWGCHENAASLTCLFEELHREHCRREGLQQWASLYCGESAGHWCRPEAHIRKLEKLRLVLGLADRVGEQNSKLETLMCHSANPGALKLPRIEL